MTRQERRQAQRFLKRLGCRCIPTFEGPPDKTAPVVSHHLGCPLGDVLLTFNQAGYMPAIIAPMTTRCER